MKNFLLDARAILDDYKKNNSLKSNRHAFNEQIKSLLLQYPYIEEKSPTLFNYLKNSPEIAIENGVYISKKDFDLENTLVISAHTFDVYALTNTLSMKDIMKLSQKYPEMGLPAVTRLDQKLKYIIGEGGFGKVRFAKNLSTGNYVAVKKITQLKAAKSEIDSYSAVGNGKNLVRLYTHATVINKNNQEKSYLFIEFIQGGDGKKYCEKIENDININAQQNPEDAKELKRISKEYLASAAELHTKGVFHCDIKPENFLHATNGDIKIIDYGLYTTNKYKIGGGTIYFACPEMFPDLGNTHLYDAQKHDSFSLGLCLLEQAVVFEKRDTQKKLIDSLGNSHAVKIYPIQIKNRTGIHFSGFKNTQILAGRNIDEVIMKLMDKDPAKRITAEEALRLPYFSGGISQRKNSYDDVD
jgi:serine/threonine protein kinase